MLHMHRERLPQPAREAMERGLSAFRLMSLDQLTAAAAAFREAAQIAPGSARPWSYLALVYRWLYWFGHGQEAYLNAQRARDAAATALQIDPDNGDAQAALATLRPIFRNWLAFDDACKPIIARHSDAFGIGLPYVDLLSNVGRIRDVNRLARRMQAKDAGWPSFYVDIVLSSWCLGRIDEADTAMDHAFQQWPRSVNIWFLRQRLLSYSGRAAAAIAMVEDADNRPIGVPDWQFDLAAAESHALLTQSRSDIDTAARSYMERARESVGLSINAIQFFAMTGRLDDAFGLLNAFYFNRGFDVGERLYTEEQGAYSERRNRSTWTFWLPFMADLRADSRTAKIIQDVGLSDYWRKSGTRPDLPIAGLPDS